MGILELGTTCNCPTRATGPWNYQIGFRCLINSCPACHGLAVVPGTNTIAQNIDTHQLVLYHRTGTGHYPLSNHISGIWFPTLRYIILRCDSDGSSTRGFGDNSENKLAENKVRKNITRSHKRPLQFTIHVVAEPSDFARQQKNTRHRGSVPSQL